MKQGVRKAWPSAPMFMRGYMSSWDTNTLQFTCYFSAPRPCFTLKRELTTRLQFAVFSYRSVIFQVGLLQWLHGTPSFAVQLSVWSGRLFIEAKQCCNCWTGKEPVLSRAQETMSIQEGYYTKELKHRQWPSVFLLTLSLHEDDVNCGPCFYFCCLKMLPWEGLKLPFSLLHP